MNKLILLTEHFWDFATPPQIIGCTLECCINSAANHTWTAPHLRAEQRRIEGAAGNCYFLACLRCLPTPTLPRPFYLPASLLDIAHSRNCLGSPPWCWAECWVWVVQQCMCFLGYHNKLLATGCLQTREINFLRSGGQESETSKAAFPPEALRENSSLLLPASRGSKCFLPCGCHSVSRDLSFLTRDEICTPSSGSSRF